MLSAAKHDPGDMQTQAPGDRVGVTLSGGAHWAKGLTLPRSGSVPSARSEALWQEPEMLRCAQYDSCGVPSVAVNRATTGWVS